MRGPSVLSLVHYLAAAVLAGVIVLSANDVVDAHRQLSLALSPEARSEAAIQDMLELLTLGLYSGATEDRQLLAAQSARIHQLWQRASALSTALLSWSALFLTWCWWRRPRRGFVIHALATAWLFLAVGLIAPMLSIVASREVPLLGEVVLRYESKAIWTTVTSLVVKGQSAVGLALALFSIVLPVLKLLASCLALGNQSRVGAWCRRTVHYVGKWSLTDVFVVAVLVSFLAAEAGDSTDAWIGHGLWFFAAYASLSWIAGHLLERMSRDGAATT
ncbi:MAG: paraquat-inducible protein A [Pseudomonadota bacterium]